MRYIALFCLFIVSLDHRCVAEEYDAASLIDLAPHIEIGSPLVTSFHVHGDGIAVHSSFDVMYARPGRVSIRFTDMSDGTPFLVTVGRKVLIYDAQRGRLITGGSKSISFYFRGDDATKSLVCAAYIDEDSIDTVRVDVRSLLAMINSPKFTIADGIYDLNGLTPTGNSLHAFFAPNEMVPLKRLSLLGPDRTVLFGVDPIEINQPIVPTTWDFPTDRQLSGMTTVPLQPWLQESKAARTLFTSVPTVQFRAALRDSKLREEWESTFGKVDWQFAGRRDAEISAQLRQLFKVIPSIR